MTILASGSSVSFFVFVSLIAALFTVTFHIISHSYNGLDSSVITRCGCCLVSMAVASSVSIVSLGQRLDSTAISLSSPLGGGSPRVSISPCNQLGGVFILL